MSQENYLEVIDEIVRQNGAARVKDIARAMDVKAASVTGILQSLAELGMVNYKPHQLITLTELGKRRARVLQRRHQSLARFFSTVLGLGESEADETACKVEHVISSKVADRLLQYARFNELCPRHGPRWIQGVGYRCVNMEGASNCSVCVDADLLEELEE